MIYDFIDIGSSKGGSVNYARRYGPDGYGIDIAEHKVKKAQDKGVDVRLMDIQDVASNSAKWCTCLHVLEHLRTRKEAKEMIAKMVDIATVGVDIHYPNFDDDSKLFELGCRFFWSRWIGHRLHLSRLELYHICQDLNLNFTIKKWGKVDNTNHPSIVPVDAPVDGFEYTINMGNKPIYLLDRVHREIRCIIKI